MLFKPLGAWDQLVAAGLRGQLLDQPELAERAKPVDLVLVRRYLHANPLAMSSPSPQLRERPLFEGRR